jgi:hypothetical protein
MTVAFICAAISLFLWRSPFGTCRGRPAYGLLSLDDRLLTINLMNMFNTVTEQLFAQRLLEKSHAQVSA